MADTTTALSSHGMIWSIQLTPGGAFTEVAQLGDLNLPEFSRNEHGADVHQKHIDQWVLSILRRGAFTVPLNFIPSNNTHDHLTGLYKLLFDNTITGHKLIFPPSAGSLEWVMSGQVQKLGPGAPVDGKLALDATMRFSGFMSIGGVLIGTTNA